eukprot:CAMPEP_0173471812 /NCGR_PEP_ID=MMETSP1357-20121228/78582_1 /TAXON_ID=77926 /ORGANISM="Hemiselmis rufescens, Strain PCC563" /LENGTH=113 /DNA_ID=CAMNT_0014440125 /DNA_START=551 /DNA_END=892 /DNA_ORIENTATION=+
MTPKDHQSQAGECLPARTSGAMQCLVPTMLVLRGLSGVKEPHESESISITLLLGTSTITFVTLTSLCANPLSFRAASANPTLAHTAFPPSLHTLLCALKTSHRVGPSTRAVTM